MRGGDVVRISFENADRLSVEVRQYETEDELDCTTLRPVPEGVTSYAGPITKAEAAGGAEFRSQLRGYLVRSIVTWPNDRPGPVYTVTYGGTGRGQLTFRQACCIDAMSGEAIDAIQWTETGAFGTGR